MEDNNSNSGCLIWIFIFIFFIFPMISSFISEEGDSWNDYARITDMNYKAIVVDEPDSEGKIVVTERFTFDIHAASQYNGFWELWRDLCEDYVDGLKVHYKVNSVKQIMPDGRELLWKESDKLYWDDWDYVSTNKQYGPGKWFHSPGPYNEEYERYECIFFYVDNLYRGEITFEIEYEMYNAVLRYNDCSDLYIAMYSGDTTKYLESFHGEILIPNKDMPKQGNYKATTYGTTAWTFPIKESATQNPGYYTFSFDLGKEELQFKPYNSYIEFDLVSYGDDKHIFAEYANVNDYYSDDVLEEVLAEQDSYVNAPTRYKTIKLTVLGICSLISIILMFSALNKISKLKNKYPNYADENTLNLFRDIPSDLDPKFAATLVFCKDKKQPLDDAGVYSSLLLSLARKKYLKLQEISTDEVMITIEKERTYEETMLDFIPIEEKEPLTICEQHYLNLIKRHIGMLEDSISMSRLQERISSDFTYTNSFVNNIKKSIVDNGVGLGYFQKSRYLEPQIKLKASSKTHIIWGFIFLLLVNFVSHLTPLDFAFGGFTLLGIVSILLGYYLKSQAHKYVLLTEFGEREYTKWRGLYNFLKSDTLINERTIIELPLWEKYLVYATAFGISEKVIEAIKIRCPEITEATANSIVHNSYCRSGRIHTHSRRFHSSIHHSLRSHSSSGGFGYGGGGRGGGGGGGGH